MRISVKFDPQKASKNLKEKIEKLKEDKEWKESAAQLVIRKVVGETRLGRFIGDGSNQKALAPETIANRKRLKKYNETGTSYGDAKSNVTLSGQLLKSLQRIDHKTQVVIEPTGDREPYKKKDGTPVKSTPTNSELLRFLREQRRKVLGYDDKLAKQIKKMLKEHLRRFLN